jgi:hypothetical protein
MRFQTIELPSKLTGHSRTVLRHIVTLPDGTVHFQDEELEYDGNVLNSRRTVWAQINTPIAEPPVVGIIDFGGIPLAMRADGQAYLWGQVEMELPDQGTVMVDQWTRFMQKVPV